MKNIILMCAGGMSTSMLMKNIQKAADAEGFACTVSAHPVAKAADLASSADVFLLGPQVGYQADDVRAKCPDVPVAVIDMSVYGMMDGKKALEIAKQAMGV